jgi:hypothetical protein
VLGAAGCRVAKLEGIIRFLRELHFLAGCTGCTFFNQEFVSSIEAVSELPYANFDCFLT